MNTKNLKNALADLPLGTIRYFDRLGSTNDSALAWAAEDAADLSLVVADEQTAGRGRLGRRWYTSSGAALAFSLVLRPALVEKHQPSLITGLGALSLVQVLQKNYNLSAQIKWPNDVLVQGRKVAGILVETVWMGDQIESLVLGMGVNVLTPAVPPQQQLDFPATSLEDVLKEQVDRLALLHDLLASLIEWRATMGKDEFIKAWESSLAYHGEQIQVRSGLDGLLTGQLLGLEPDGSLRLCTSGGHLLSVHFGDVHLRPVGV